ncbi:MAG: adenylate kinase [Candidatus Hydrogenedentota bacterium]
MAGRIIILGGPGAGKGTQARRIAKKFDIPQISTGDIFRSHTEQQTEIGQKIEEYMNSGQLVPDPLACQIVVERLAQSDCSSGYILDGFPRSLPQAEALEQLLADRGEGLDVALVLKVADEEIVERLAARRTCPKCGKIYNLIFKQPKRDGYCDAEGCDTIELVQREDDTEATIRKRLAVYHETTEPLLDFYTERDLRRDVGGPNQTPEKIAAQIEEILMAKGASES